MYESIQHALRQLGITHNYRGYRQTMIATYLVLEDETRLYNVTQDIYPIVAARCGCNTATVERNIRTVILRTWRFHKKTLIEMAGFPMENSPTVSQFIDIIANHVRTQNCVAVK